MDYKAKSEKMSHVSGLQRQRETHSLTIMVISSLVIPIYVQYIYDIIYVWLSQSMAFPLSNYMRTFNTVGPRTPSDSTLIGDTGTHCKRALSAYLSSVDQSAWYFDQVSFLHHFLGNRIRF